MTLIGSMVAEMVARPGKPALYTRRIEDDRRGVAVLGGLVFQR